MLLANYSMSPSVHLLAKLISSLFQPLESPSKDFVCFRQSLEVDSSRAITLDW